MATQASETAALQPISGTKAVRRNIQQLLEGPELRTAIKAALPRHLTPERFIRIALNATMRQPRLLECTQESFFRCLLDLSSYGLEPDGRRAHLIPFKNKKTNQYEVQLVLDYKGIAELVRRSGDVSYIHADVVAENDTWSFTFGTGAHLTHTPSLADRGAPIAYYSFVKLKDGSEDFMVMSPGEVEKIRQRSKSPNEGPWVTDYDEMGKKTVFKRHSKWLPLSPEVRDAIERDDDAIDIAAADTLKSSNAIRASISLADIKPSSDPNRGHDATNGPPEAPSAAKPSLKHLGKKGDIAVYNELPPPNTVGDGQKVWVRHEDGTESLHTFAADFDNGDGSHGAWLLSFE